MEGQVDIFELLYEPFKINKPIRLIELFSGYGSQALALKYLDVMFEHWKTCEWAIKSIQAYKDIHFANDNIDYSKELTEEEIKEYLFNKGISSNYNEPMKKQQVDKLKDYRKIYNNIQATHNLVNIQQVKGKDLEIVDKDKYCYMMTYSFPCQDLSLAGKGKGMSDTTTRSGMLWEVERILTECKEKPQILLMENVPQVHSQDNVDDFNKWQYSLEKMGYKNYWQDLIATDYGIPQTRNRTFMVSILGDYSYTFPKPIPLKLKLKDMLEDNVDEKYYLSDSMIKYISADNEKWTGNNNEALINKTYASTLNTNEGSRRCDASNYISDDVGDNYNLKTNNKSLKETLEQNEIDDTCYIDTYNKRIDKEKSGTITTGTSFRNNTFLAIKNATKKGYLEANNGDGIDISSRMEHHRGTVQKGKAQTLTTQCDRDVVINNINSKVKHQQDIIQDSNGNARNLVCGTHGNGGHYTKTLMNDLRIRKLTPKECFRLMGVKDEDFEKVMKNQSDSSLYHLTGDSIVVNVLMAIFKELL